MGCGCGKSATPPTGSTPPESQVAAATPAGSISAASKAPAGSSTPRETPTQQSFALTTRDGKTQTFGSKLEADAERVRRGGGSVRPVR